MSTRRTALVLSGGGIRGAYEAGVVEGILEVSGQTFDVFVGTSAGAINAVVLASMAHLPPPQQKMAQVWQELDPKKHTRLHGIRTRWRQGVHSLLDPTPIAELIGGAIDFDALHQNIDEGRVKAVIVPALHIASGTTHMFAELASDVVFPASRDPRRSIVPTRLTVDHVLASAAIPLMFPPQRVGQHHYFDGGLRFNTPIAPALRAGATHLAVVAPILPGEVVEAPPTNPSMSFLLGKLLNALILDPVLHDLQILERFNRVVDVLDDVLTDEERARVDAELVATRRAPYRNIKTLVFLPTEDIGAMAARHLRTNLHRFPLAAPIRRWLRRVLRDGQEADWASWVALDGPLAEEIAQLGRRDALARADEIRAFFQ